MAWYQDVAIPSYKKEYIHNLNHQPIVVAYINLESIGQGVGWKQIPFKYSGDDIWSEEDGFWIGTVGTVEYYHKDDNTVVFTAPLNAEIVADIFIDPQYNAWYE